MAFRIVSIGDSIIWGQGLLPNEKFNWLVQQALLPMHPEGVTLESLAHSGAVIGATGASGTPQVGEVPASRLSIIEQCDNYANSPETVDLVLMDGGINDVGVASILNPFALIPPLDVRVVHACHDGMLVLLKKVIAKFSKPTCRILVTGYYPILSAQSDPLGVIKLVSLFGIAVPAFLDKDLDFINPVLDRCEAFFNDSTQQLKQAIVDAKDPRITFVPSGFTDANSAFVPGTSLLWGLTLDDDLSPQDPVAAARHPLCDVAHPDPLQIPEREICYRASGRTSKRPRSSAVQQTSTGGPGVTSGAVHRIVAGLGQLDLRLNRLNVTSSNPPQPVRVVLVDRQSHYRSAYAPDTESALPFNSNGHS